MSKIKELLNDKKSILVFDVDGVLALLEFGERNHYYYAQDDEWDKKVNEGLNLYTVDKVSNKMVNFLKNKDMNRVYVITNIGVQKEGEYKKEYLTKYYKIKKENIYFVNNNKKKDALIEIRNKHKDIKDENIIMIDDTPSVLSDIQDKTPYSTAHISSFLDI